MYNRIKEGATNPQHLNKIITAWYMAQYVIQCKQNKIYHSTINKKSILIYYYYKYTILINLIIFINYEFVVNKYVLNCSKRMRIECKVLQNLLLNL